MTDKKIRELLKLVERGVISADRAFEDLKYMPFEDLDHTKIDHHRAMRKGIGEVIFGEGKTLEQLSDIIAAIRSHDEDVLVTRIDRGTGESLVIKFPSGVYNSDARCFMIRENPAIHGKGIVLVLSAGTSDMGVAEEAYMTATFLGNRTNKLYDVGVAGIHRLLSHMDILKSARVIIVTAGMEGALPSVVAGIVGVPVIGVPTSTGYGASFGGIAALLAMLNSCSTVSVFNIDNGFGAAYFATLINRL